MNKKNDKAVYSKYFKATDDNDLDFPIAFFLCGDTVILTRKKIDAIVSAYSHISWRRVAR